MVLTDGVPVSAAELPPLIEIYHLGSPHGQHSGVEDCLMRYENATAVQVYRQKDARYRLFGQGEKYGFTFCSSSKGTGVNAPGDSFDHPRYGDAAPKRGNCIAQLCVNDAKIAEHNGR